MFLIYFILLFQNIMTFNKCSIAGKCYGDLIDEATNEVLEITEVGELLYYYLFFCTFVIQLVYKYVNLFFVYGFLMFIIRSGINKFFYDPAGFLALLCKVNCINSYT